jgi:predicted aspartyl protease
MSFAFNAADGLVIVSVRVEGPAGHTFAQLALDTGATATLIQTATLVSIGYDPAAASDRVLVTTGSGVEYVPLLPLLRVEALGQARTSFLVVAHTLPPSAAVEGLLGLDFLRGQRLTIDFQIGDITLA